MAASTTPAAASQMIARDASGVTIKVGMLRHTEVAAVTYKSAGTWHHVLVWGAMNARTYSLRVRQVEFKVNYSGGYGSVFGARAWARISNRCVPDAALKRHLPLAVAVCTMRSNPHEHWALQSWQRLMPNAGVHPRSWVHIAHELHMSHWTDAYMPVLWLKWDWANGRDAMNRPVHFDHLYGVFAFNGHRVYGHHSTHGGNPLDSYGRNIYVDTLNPVWARDGAYQQPGGWIRFNGFLTHYPHGDFCASVYPTNLGVSRPGYSAGTLFRATAMGPGVTPIVRWTGPPPGHYAPGGFNEGFAFAPTIFPGLTAKRTLYDKVLAQAMNDEQRQVAGSADTCYKVYGPHS